MDMIRHDDKSQGVRNPLLMDRPELMNDDPSQAIVFEDWFALQSIGGQ